MKHEIKEVANVRYEMRLFDTPCDWAMAEILRYDITPRAADEHKPYGVSGFMGSTNYETHEAAKAAWAKI